MIDNQQVTRLQNIPGIGVDRIGDNADKQQDPEILRLENLDTDIAPPQIAIDVTRLGIGKDNNNSYLPFFGQNALRQAVTKHVSQVSGINYNWTTQCIISTGGLSGILNCLLALVNPGDEVIVTDPIYAGIINRIHLSGGIVKYMQLIPSPEGWRLDKESLYAAVSKKTRLILVTNPSMPTGHVLTMDEWEAIVEICNYNNIWLLYNAAMERILYDNRIVIHPASLPNMENKTIIVGSASKELRMIGWRVGWIVGPQNIINDIKLVSLSNVVCPVGIGMAGVTAALTTSDDGLKNAINIWQIRRDILLNELKDFPITPAHGGWSMLLDTQKLGISSTKFSEKLLNQAKIAATPMIGWGNSATSYIRLVFSNENENRLIGIGTKIKAIL